MLPESNDASPSASIDISPIRGQHEEKSIDTTTCASIDTSQTDMKKIGNFDKKATLIKGSISANLDLYIPVQLPVPFADLVKSMGSDSVYIDLEANVRNILLENSCPFLSSVDVLELSDKTKSVQTHPPKIATSEKSKSVAAGMTDFIRGHGKFGSINIQEPREICGELLDKTLALLLSEYCNGFNVIYNTSPTLSHSITSPSFRVTFKASPLNLR
ncbi:Uncharacterized protein Rs2_09792 [Raphanus sativus]|nr:Uncharacterized protein Rs2_09792 [Raphanus sativus]